MVHTQLYLIHMALWNFVLFFFFFWIQSPDIITSHNPLSDITNPSWDLFSPIAFSLLLLPPFQRPSLISPVSGHSWPSPCKTAERRLRRPLQFDWTASSSSMLIDERLKTPNTPEIHPNVRWQVMITLEGRDQWDCPQVEGPLVAVCHVCSHTHQLSPIKGFAGFWEMREFFFFFLSEYFVALIFLSLNLQ